MRVRGSSLKPLREVQRDLELSFLSTWPWEKRWRGVLLFRLGAPLANLVEGAQRDARNRIALTVRDKAARAAVTPLLPDLARAFRDADPEHRDAFVRITP